MEKFLLPVRVFACDNADGAENLLIDKPLQCGFKNEGYTTLKQGGYLLLDFGREIRGGIVVCARSVSTYPRAAKCRFVFGESVMEAYSSIGYKNATNDHAVRDTVVDVPFMGNVRFGNTGYRFFKIEALEGDIVIKSIKAELDHRDIKPIGSFECSDARLNEIWRTGAYTVYLNMGEYVWDGIKRDRLVWLGDLHPEASVIYSVWGADPSIKNSLELVRSETPTTEWINTLPSYSFWWVINLYEWYMHTGDTEYLAESLDYVRAIVARGCDVARSDPARFCFFVDWSTEGNEILKRFGFYCVMHKCFSTAAKIAEIFGDTELSELCRCGKDAILTLDIPLPDQKQMAGLAVFSDLADATEVNDTVLSRDPLDGLSTFMGYYALLAKGKAGDVRGALDVIRGFWGAMLDLGATTFWEDFDIRWAKNAARIDELPTDDMNDVHGDNGKGCYVGYRHSLCHGWAGGPTAFMSQYVLGVNVVEPGCKKLMIKPDLGDLEWARGSFPTPYGPVYVDHRRDGEGILTKVDAPKEVEIQLKP